MKMKGGLDVDERREISEMLERGEQLRRRIRGDKESDEKEDDDSEVDGEGEKFSWIKASAFEELAKINREDAGEDASDRPAIQRTGGRAVYHPAATVSFWVTFLDNALMVFLFLIVGSNGRSAS